MPYVRQTGAREACAERIWLHILEIKPGTETFQSSPLNTPHLYNGFFFNYLSLAVAAANILCVGHQLGDCQLDKRASAGESREASHLLQLCWIPCTLGF